MKGLMSLLVLALVAGASALHCTGECQTRDSFAKMPAIMEHKMARYDACGDSCVTQCDAKSGVRMACTEGYVGEYACGNMDLLAMIPLADLGSAPGADGSDIWGWTDSTTNREYVIMTQMDGTSFVDISDPINPLVLGFLPAQVENFTRQYWHDAKVYKDHAFIVGDNGAHGMQVFDLRRLRGLHENYQGITQLTVDAFYDEFGPCHNIDINEESGYGYCIGSNTCRGGLHMVDIFEPTNPQFVGCAANDGYVHDSQCVNYDGPDERFVGREICFGYNEDSLTIYDVTNKDEPCVISRTEYKGAAYTHQGWLTEDSRYVLMNDEFDELTGTAPSFTQTYIWNVESLTHPEHFANYSAPVTSIDHNIYIRGQYSYQSNYASGLRINDITNVANGELAEVAFFDVYPENDDVDFFGTWSNYPYFESGVVAVSSIDRGLFLLLPTAEGMPELSPAVDREVVPTEPPTVPWWWWFWGYY